MKRLSILIILCLVVVGCGEYSPELEGSIDQWAFQRAPGEWLVGTDIEYGILPPAYDDGDYYDRTITKRIKDPCKIEEIHKEQMKWALIQKEKIDASLAEQHERIVAAKKEREEC